MHKLGNVQKTCLPEAVYLVDFEDRELWRARRFKYCQSGGQLVICKNSEHPLCIGT
jgi:hypothetical protein